MSTLCVVVQPPLIAPFIVSGADAFTRPKAHCERVQRPILVASKFDVELDETTSDSAIRSLSTVLVVTGIALAAGEFPRAAGAVFVAV